MKTKVIKIGNSRGIKIPKPFLEQSGIENEVELEVKGNSIIIKPFPEIRKDWDAAFQKMSENKNDLLFDRDALSNQSSWDDEEWTW